MPKRKLLCPFKFPILGSLLDSRERRTSESLNFVKSKIGFCYCDKESCALWVSDKEGGCSIRRLVDVTKENF